MPALRQALREESLSARKRSDPVYDGSCLQVWAERATPARAWERFVEVHEMCDEVIGSVKFEMVRLKNDDGSDNLRFFDMCPRRVSCAHATGVRAELYRGVPVGGMEERSNAVFSAFDRSFRNCPDRLFRDVSYWNG